MDPPHYSPITSLSSRPGGGSYLFVSTASDGHFKLWTTETAKDNRQRWYCQAESYYLKEVAIGSAFSQDGSLLAVVYNSVSLYAPLNHFVCIVHLRIIDEKDESFCVGNSATSYKGDIAGV